MKIPQNIKVAVDAVVFGYEQKELSVLLIKRGVALIGVTRNR